MIRIVDHEEKKKGEWSPEQLLRGLADDLHLLDLCQAFCSGHAEERPPISCHLPPRLPPPYNNIPCCQLYTYVAFSLRQPWCPLHAAARRDAALPPSPPGNQPVLGVPSASPARGLAERHVFGRNRGRAQTPPTGRTGRVKEGQIWAPKSLPQKPGGPGR